MTPLAEPGFKPIFIVGSERSGTTMLAGLFDRHSRVAVPPETHLFYNLTPRQRRDRWQADHDKLVEFVFARDRFGDMGLERDDVLARFRGCEPNLRRLFRLVLEEYAHRRGKPRIAEKSPHHLFCVPTILRWYPEAKIVCIVRDGRDAVLSLLNVPWAHNDAWIHSANWCRFARVALRCEKGHAARFTCVRFEDLLRDPRRELTRLASFLDLEFEERQLDAAVATSVVPEWESDWKQKANRELDPSRIGAWRRTATREQLWVMNAVMGRYLRRLGYGDAGLESCPRRLRLRNRIVAALHRVAYGPRVHPALRSAKSLLVRVGFPEDWRSVLGGDFDNPE